MFDTHDQLINQSLSENLNGINENSSDTNGFTADTRNSIANFSFSPYGMLKKCSIFLKIHFSNYL